MTVKDLPLLAAGCLLPHTMGADICNPGGCLVLRHKLVVVVVLFIAAAAGASYITSNSHNHIENITSNWEQVLILIFIYFLNL